MITSTNDWIVFQRIAVARIGLILITSAKDCFFFNPSPPMAQLTVAGKFGGFLQVAADARLMISQVSISGYSPPQMSSWEKPLYTIIIFRLG